MKRHPISATAAFIAIKYYGLTRDEPWRSMLDKEIVEFYDRLTGSLPPPYRKFHGLLQSPVLRRLLAMADEALLRGDLMHILMRKKIITEQIARLKEDGYEQLVVLGAGVDHQSLYWSHRNMTCIEIDRPAMAAFKREFLAEEYERSWGGGPEILEGVLPEQSIPGILETSGLYDPKAPTLLVAEGFFDYLEEETVRENLEQIRNRHSAPLRLITTAFDLDQLHPFHRFWFKTGVRLAGERLKLYMDLEPFRLLLKRSGWMETSLKTFSQMKREYLDKHGISYPVLNGFHLINASASGR